MNGVAAKISARAPRSRKDLKPQKHHFFYVLVWFAGWLLPPLAIAIRFGIGRDFFINVIATICAYVPGQIHNFYCQSVRNNRTQARTPKWAVKYGLVKVKDKRGGKHQWAGRYDERLPDSSRRGYGEEDSASNVLEWDGHGPEPERIQRTSSRLGSSSKSGGFHLTAPWDRTVEEEEVEGNPFGARPGTENFGNGSAYDPLDNEQFYSTTNGADSSQQRPASLRSNGRKKGLKGKLSHRDRYENTSNTAGNDRHNKMKAARNSQPVQDEYQDEFERELNTGRRQPVAAPPVGRVDSYDRDGPEDAWAASRPAGERRQENRSNGVDGDLFNHTF